MPDLVQLTSSADSMAFDWPALWARLQGVLEPFRNGVSVPNCGHVDDYAFLCGIDGGELMGFLCAEPHVRSHDADLDRCGECGDGGADVHRGDVARYRWTHDLSGSGDMEIVVCCLWLCTSCETSS